MLRHKTRFIVELVKLIILYIFILCRPFHKNSSKQTKTQKLITWKLSYKINTAFIKGYQKIYWKIVANINPM